MHRAGRAASLLAMMEKQSYMSEIYEIHIDSHLSSRLKYFARVRDLGLTLLNVKIREDKV